MLLAASGEQEEEAKEEGGGGRHFLKQIKVKQARVHYREFLPRVSLSTARCLRPFFLFVCFYFLAVSLSLVRRLDERL